MLGTAIISADGIYRYRLERDLSPLKLDSKVLAFVMLNPSVADAAVDDPTIRRCIGFARREGAGRLIVVNLYAFRSTDPRGLLTAKDPIGPENADHLKRVAAECETVVLAWGNNADPEVATKALHMMSEARLVCLGVTKTGAPKHPLYVAAAQPLVPYRASLGSS